MSFSASIRIKLLSVVVLLAAVSGGIGVVAWRSLSAANDRLTHIVGVTAEAQSLPGRIRANFTRAHREEKSMLLSDSPEEFDKHFELAESAHAHTRELIGQLEQVVTGPSLEEVRRFRAEYEAFNGVSRRVVDLARENTDGQAYTLSRTRGDRIHDEADAFVQSLVDSKEVQAAEYLDQIASSDGSVGIDQVTSHLAAIELAQHIHKAWIRLRQLEKSYVLSIDAAVKDDYAKKIDAQFVLIAERIAAITPNLGETERDQLDNFGAKSAEWRRSNEEIRRLSRMATMEQAEHLSAGEGESAFQRARDALMNVIEMADAAMEAEVAEARREYARSLWIMIGSAVLGVVVAMAIAMRIIGAITRTITDVLERMRQVAAGNLVGEAIRVSSRDEVGRLAEATNEMQSSLREIVMSIASNSEQVSAAATEVAATSEQMALSSEHQRAQLTQVAAAVEQMAATVTEVSGRTGEVSRQSTDAGNQATQGGDIVRRTVEEMGQIASQVESTSSAVGALSEKAVKIGEILTVINDIADQTNLLALNAAIEAARAGEHGRGFAVVADEVRKLAERTQEATQEVSRSITEIQSSTGEATEMMDASKDRVTSGVQLAQQAGESLESIVRGSTTVAQSIDSIAAAVEEQSATSTEIARSIEVISASADEATQGANQAAAAATQLSGNAESLRELVSRFRV
jgi:methyl-accepting chemotaxis protein